MIKRIGVMAFVALCWASALQAQTGGPVVIQAVDNGTGATVPKVGDAANNAINVHIKASDVAAGGTSQIDNSSFTQGTTTVTPAAGLYTTAWTNPTSGRASIFREDINGGIYTNLDRINTNAILTGNGTTGTGSLRVTISSDNTAFTVNAAQSGTWTVQPGNTANTTQWLVKSGPFDACGTTTYDPAPVKIPDATLDILTATTTCVESIVVTNISAAAATITIQDTQGTPVELFKALTVAPNQTVALNNLGGLKFASGIKYQASSANALNIWVKGRQ